ncbi:hypothetical protein VZT92_006588 [Zoarces viviparus]
MKLELEGNKVQLPYVENSKVDLLPSRFPSISSKGGLAGKRCVPAAVGIVPVGVEGSHYLAQGTGRQLPHFSRAQTGLMKQKLEGNKVQLPHVKNSKVDLLPSHFPSISSKGGLAGKRCVPAAVGIVPVGVEGSHYLAQGTGRQLPHFSRAQTGLMKQKLEGNKVQLPHVKNSKVDLLPSRFPSISSKGGLAGKRCVPAAVGIVPVGVEGSHYLAQGTGRQLPHISRAQTGLMKQKLEGNKVQLPHVKNSKVDLLPSRFPSTVLFGL